MKRKISVQLDDVAEKSLIETMNINRCSISDVVNAAIISFANDKQPVMIFPDSPVVDIINQIEAQGANVDYWCSSRNISKTRLYYLIRRTAKGHNVCGFGNTKNKWRDKQDGRLFKTHTAWIAHCLKEDFDITL